MPSGPPFCYDYPRPMVTVDLVVFALAETGLRSLFIKRNRAPYAGRWAIPGGYLEIDEPIEDAALRELAEETGIQSLELVREIGVFGAPGRDPRGRTISVAHLGLIRGLPPAVRGGDDAGEARWLDPIDPRTGPDLAFDHQKILGRALTCLADGLGPERYGARMLPETFDKADVDRLWRAVRGTSRGAARTLRDLVSDGWIAPLAESPGAYCQLRL